MPNAGEFLDVMLLLDRLNFVSVFLIGIFILPVVIGLFRPLTAERIYTSFNAVLSAAAVILSAVISFIVLDYLFSNEGANPLARLFSAIPAVWYSIENQDILVYLMFFLIIFLGLNGAFQLLLILINKKVLYPAANKLGGCSGFCTTRLQQVNRRALAVPESVWLVLVFAMLFNFYAMLSSNSLFDQYIHSSGAFRLINAAAIQPMMSLEAVQQIPELVNRTVEQTVACLSPEGRKMLIKVYINGVTVQDAVKSSPEIDNLAIDLVDAESDNMIMAKRLYEWVSANISYDRVKAIELETDAFGAPSGAWRLSARERESVSTRHAFMSRCAGLLVSGFG